MRKDQLIKGILKEIENIKIHATDAEKEKLDFSMFSGGMSGHCIYGLMTGNCYSKRAGELIKKCVSGKGIVGMGIGHRSSEEYPSLDQFVGMNNFLPDLQKSIKSGLIRTLHTKLEWYVFKLSREQVKPIIDYIKGNTDVVPEIIIR